MNIYLTRGESRVDLLAEARAYWSLFKPRVVLLLVFTSVVAAFVASHGSVPPAKVALLVVVGTFAAAGSACLNNYRDRDIDAVMRRTRARILPSGRAHPNVVLSLGLSLLATSLLLAAQLNHMVSLYVLLGAFVYVGIYSLWLKRTNPLNIVIGGLSGSFAVMAGWAVVDPQLSLTPVLLGLLVFLWTPHHFWSFAMVYREDYRKVGLPMLPLLLSDRQAARLMLLSTVALVAASLMAYFSGPFGRLYLAFALGAGALLLAVAYAQERNPTRELGWQNFKASGAYLLVLFAAMLVDIYT